MKDERIQTTVNHIARRGFIIYFVLMMISINYRLWILKQHPREFWDFMAIFSIASLFVFIAYARKGVFDQKFKRFWFAICIVIIIVNITLMFIIGRIHSIFDMVAFLSASLLGVGLCIAIAYFLNRRWKRKEGIEDEK
ncbi:MAG: DUF6773 family protein [Planctomycetota bacterium]|jgi:hypothetical protein